ncbi:alkaline phosphatase family protein [Cognaticolwellia mytili]|uniref:alkaline phosphatase family protein n=1 Tax=Cognaticolwellia mytili TaxID=1888913 RepID=UPI000A1766CC|nr:ectonucleotide pyrophosphatase/phosphodiesterase [Cognaticolwellia mytili]
MKISTGLLFCCLFSAFTSAKTPLVLLSIDGFAQRYLETYQPKALNSLVEQGTSAKALLPVFPSKTFPNHLSIITGQYPANHGIVHNSFFNRDINEKYKLGAGKNDARWLTADPLWHINERQGNKSAVYFWPESETSRENKTASYYYPYKHSTPNKTRFDQILNWLRLPAAERPNFITGYFASIDDAGHDFGENSPELIQAITELDNLLAEFVEQINTEFSGQVNLVIVSDHGMTKIDKKHVIKWKNMQIDDVKVINGSTQLYLYSDNNQKLQESLTLFQSQQEEQKGYQIYQHPNFPAHWQLNTDGPSIPNAIIDAEMSYIFDKGRSHIDPETHGYDPKSQRDLDAIFIATGPSFKKNVQIDAFNNVNVLPIITRALGLKDVDNIDGTYQIADEIVRK